MSGSRWVTTLSWLSGSLRPFHTIFLCILATSSLSLLRLLGPYCFCPLLCPACMKCSLGISDFLEDISSLSQAIVFLFLCIVYVGRLFFFFYLSLLFFETLNSEGYIFPFLPLFASLIFSAICKASPDNHFAFLHFFFLRSGLLFPTQEYLPDPGIKPMSCASSRLVGRLFITEPSVNPLPQVFTGAAVRSDWFCCF